MTHHEIAPRVVSTVAAAISGALLGKYAKELAGRPGSTCAVA